MSKKNRHRNKKRKSAPKRSPKVEPKALFERGDFAGAAVLEARPSETPSDDLRRFLVGCYLKDSEHSKAAETLLSLEDKTANHLGMAGW